MIKPHPNVELWDIMDRVGTFVLANLLWVLLAIPVVTLPLATAGLFATLSPWTRGKSAEVFRDFFGGMRQHWRKALLVGAIDLVIGGWMFLNFCIFRLMGLTNPLAILSQVATLFVTLTGLMANLYTWPLMVTFDLSLRNLLLNSLRLVFAHPLWSLVMLFLVAALFVLSLLLPAAVLVLASFSAAALLINWGAWRVIRPYVPENELAQLERRS